MRTLFFIAVISFGLCRTAFAQQSYAASLIPKDLMPYASAIVRNDETMVTVKEKDNVWYHHKKAVTVLNKNGADDAQLAIWYDKSQQIKSIKGVIYDEYGKPVSKFGESSFKDESAIHDFSLFEDERVKYYEPAVANYPYTVEYEYDVKRNQTLNIEPWFPAYEDGLAVEQSSYKLTCKPEFNIRYKETNYPSQVEIVDDDKGMKTYSWQVKNVKARRSEPYSPYKTNYVTSVRIALQNFTYAGISGVYTSWNDLGKWTYDKLLTGRSQLPPQTVQQIKDLTAGITDTKEKARKIYEFMQQKSRYVSIQIGIGGYQPFPAAEVDQLSYSDCKGLVNYTQALLKVAGIESYYCLVKSGSEKTSLKTDFASMDQADHVILCLPLKNDTTWLECTSKTIPFGYLGNFTDDRIVLACTPDGGKLLRTPKYTAQQNKEEINADFSISETGLLRGSVTASSSGTQYENDDDMLTESYQDQVKHIQKRYPINNMDIQSLKLSADKSINPTLTQRLKLSAHEYASADDGKLHFMVNAVNRVSGTPREMRNRNTAVYINRGYTDEDTITYELPDGFKPDRMLLNIKLHKDFGNYTANVVIEGSKLIYRRKMQIIDGTYPKETYEELVDFYQAVVDADNYTMTLVKNK